MIVGGIADFYRRNSVSPREASSLTEFDMKRSRSSMRSVPPGPAAVQPLFTPRQAGEAGRVRVHVIIEIRTPAWGDPAEESA